MSRRFLICVGTAVGLVLAAACGFMFGSSVRENGQDTEQSAYVSNWQDVSEDSAGENTSQAISGDEAGQGDSSNDTAQTDSDRDTSFAGDTNSNGEADSGGDTNSGGAMQSVSGNSVSSDAGDTVEHASGDTAGPSSDDTSLESSSYLSSNDGAASGEYEYIVYAVDGSLVVFYSDEVTVYFDSGIDVEHLPEETRNQMEQGITFESEEELFGFLESYSS